MQEKNYKIDLKTKNKNKTAEYILEQNICSTEISEIFAAKHH